MSGKFTKKYEINFYDIDSNMECKPTSLLNFLGDMNISHSEMFGETLEHMVANNYAWILYKYDVNIYEYPKYKDIISIDVEFLGAKKFYGFRGYTIKNSDGKIIGEAIALAFLINLEKRRPMRVTPEMYKIYGIDGDLDANIPMDDIAKFTHEDYSMDFTIRRSDIDSYGHLNNVRYIDMAIESLPSELINGYTLNKVNVLFKKESLYGDTIRISSQVVKIEESKMTTLHTINNSNDELTNIELQWTLN